MDLAHNLPENSSPGKNKTIIKKLRVGAARVPFLGPLPEEYWEIHHRDHEITTICCMDRVAFLEEVWALMHCYGTQSMLKTGLNRLLMQKMLDKLDECEGRMSK